MAKKILNLLIVNKILLALFIITLAYCIYDLSAVILPDIANIILKKDMGIADMKGAGMKKIAGDTAVTAVIKPLDYYLQAINNAGLFKNISIGDAADQSHSGQFQPAGLKLEEAIQSFILKGVIEGGNLQAVIEDTKTAKTYFVVKNDKIGDIIVDDIMPNKVKLRLGDRSIDLTL